MLNSDCYTFLASLSPTYRLIEDLDMKNGTAEVGEKAIRDLGKSEMWGPYGQNVKWKVDKRWHI